VNLRCLDHRVRDVDKMAHISLMRKPFVSPLLMNSLTLNSLEFMNILIRMVNVCKNSKDYETMSLPPLLLEMLDSQEWASPSSTSSQTITKEDKMVASPPTSPFSASRKENALHRLYRILYQPCSTLPPSISTTNAIISPLGLYRVKCVQLVFSLLKANYHIIDTALIEHKIIARCVDLFFQFKWNNILHCIIEKMTEFIMDSKPSYLCLHLLRDCHLLERIMQASQNEEQEKTMKTEQERGIPHQGYMGHLINIANSVIKTAKIHSAVFYFLEDVPNRGWKKFESRLKAVNKIMQTNYTGFPPPFLLEKKSMFQFGTND